jgi:hypothetical protein
MVKAMQQLAAMCDLPEGWNSYGAPVISRAAIHHAQWLLGRLPGNWQAVPCSDGSVQLEQHEGGIDVEIRVSAA